MSFTSFQRRVGNLLTQAGGGITAKFRTEDGNHYAECSDGTTIVASDSTTRVSVRWGSGHQAIAEI